jgi:hypothetical protein
MTTAFVEAGSLFCQQGSSWRGADQSQMCWLSGRFDDDTPLTVKAADIAIDSDCRATCPF